MEPGDIIVVQLDAGPRLGRYIETKASRVRIAIGRNREARLPATRIVHETGLTASSFEQVETIRHEAEAISEDLDLLELWDVVCDDRQPLTLSDIGELYWGMEVSAVQVVGLLFHLARDDLRFVRDGSHFVPVDRETVANEIARRQRVAERAADASALAAAVREGDLPRPLTDHQSDIMDHVRGFVLYDDDYSRADFAKRFLEQTGVRGRDMQRGAFDTLVALGLMDPDEHLALERAGIESEFTPEVVAEAERVNQADVLSDPTRVDLSDLLVLSIDDESTRDRDDGLSLEMIDGPAYRVGIHITDVGALLRRDSAIDTEADRRMSSLYLPEQTIPMLPAAVSTDTGSLSPGALRSAVSLLVDLAPDGEVVRWKMVRSVIRNQHALSYQAADSGVSDKSHPLHTRLRALHRLAMELRAAREAKGALNLDRDELTVKVDENGQINVSVTPRSAPSRSLVQEYMVLYNSLLAAYCSDNDLPAPFRSQIVPDVSDIEAQVPEGSLRWYLMARRLSPATVSAKAAAHGSLGVDAYTQATSPLRRYPDLVVQRQISHHLRTGETLYDESSVTSIAHRADMQVRQMSRIENNRRQYFFLKWLRQRSDEAESSTEPEAHQAVVLENPDNRSATVELVEWPFRSRVALPSSIKPGEVVPLRLHGVDLWRRTAQFTLDAAQIGVQ